VSVQRRPDLGDYSIHGEVVSGRPRGYSCYLPFKVLALVSGRHTSVYDGHHSGHGAGDVARPSHAAVHDRLARG
jgi:hypothetical protein